jgi:Putative DNA-binding domain
LAKKSSFAMPLLLKVQSAIRAQLLDDANPVAAALLAETLTPADRLSIYRNTSRIALTNTLRLNYPAVQRLVGEDFFAAAADIFITKDPPRMAWLDFYGAAFPEFLERFKPAASLPYLPDVARLERAVSLALHAADAKGLAPAELADLPQSAQSSVSFVPHPSVGLLSSKYPVDAIWRAVLAADDAALAAIDLDSGGVWLLAERAAGGVEVTRLDEQCWRFAEALFAGWLLPDALRRADSDDAPAWLAAHIAAGRFVGFASPEVRNS